MMTGMYRRAAVIMVGAYLLAACGSSATHTSAAGTADTKATGVQGTTPQIAAVCADLAMVADTTTTSQSLGQVLETPLTPTVADNLKLQASFAVARKWLTQIAQVAPPPVAHAAQVYLALLASFVAVSKSDPNYTSDVLAPILKVERSEGSALNSDTRLLNRWMLSTCHIRDAFAVSMPTAGGR